MHWECALRTVAAGAVVIIASSSFTVAHACT